MRAPLLLFGTLLAGCQLVFPLERDPVTNDEDGDGTPDDTDPCPHIANEDPTDTDDDGVADQCDLDPMRQDEHVFFSFLDGRPPELAPAGPVNAADGVIEIGSATDDQAKRDGLTIDLGARLARVDIGLEFLERKDPFAPGFEEIAVHIQHQRFGNGAGDEGIACFVGRDDVDPDHPNYVQIDNGVASNFDGELIDVARGRFTSILTVAGQNCVMELGSPDVTSSRQSTDVPEDIAGKIAISTAFVKVRLSYLWIVYTTESLDNRGL